MSTAAITTDTLRRFLETRTAQGQALATAKSLANQQRFFNWPLEFPEAFSLGPVGEGPGGREAGFDVVLGNPPWE